jgi:hypothetical protein
VARPGGGTTSPVEQASPHLIRSAPSMADQEFVLAAPQVRSHLGGLLHVVLVPTSRIDQAPGLASEKCP